jgi:hypothetical protein
VAGAHTCAYAAAGAKPWRRKSEAARRIFIPALWLMRRAPCPPRAARRAPSPARAARQ